MSNNLLFWVPIIFSVLYNVPKFFELSTCTAPEGSILQRYSNDTKLNFTYEIENNISIPVELHDDSIGVFYANSTHERNGSAANNSLDNGEMITQNCDRDGMRATILRQNELYVIFYVVISKVVLVEIIPWVAVITMNVLTWRKMKSFKETREAMLKRRNTGNKLLSSSPTRAFKRINICIIQIFNTPHFAIYRNKEDRSTNENSAGNGCHICILSVFPDCRRLVWANVYTRRTLCRWNLRV